MNRKKSVWAVSMVSIIALVSLVVLSASSAKAQQAPAKKLKIGMIACLTGFFAVHDVPDTNQAKIAAEMINEKGGITIKGQKYQIELVVADGQSTFDGITAAANYLVFDQGVKFILGPAGPFSGPSAPITNSNKVLDIILYCTNKPGELGATTPYTFLGYDGTVESVYAGIDYIKKNYPKVKKVVVLNSDDGSLPYLTPKFKKALNDAGISMLGVVSFPNETQDFNPIAARINSYKDADLVLVANTTPPMTGAILKALRELGNNTPFIQPVVSSLQAVANIAGKNAAKGVVINGVTPGNPANPPVLNEISKRVMAKYGPETTLYLQSANSLWILKQAIEAAQSLDPTAVKAQWEKIDNVKTLFGPGRMCGDKTYGIGHHAVGHALPFQVFIDGKVVFAGWSSPIYVP